MIGTNEDEGTLFSMLLPTDISDEEIIVALPETVIDARALADAYAGRTTGRRLILDLMTDSVFLVPSLRLADAQAATPAPVWVYLFTWKTPVFGGVLGATHALELPFVWDQIDNPRWQPFVGESPPRSWRRPCRTRGSRSLVPATRTLLARLPGPVSDAHEPSDTRAR